MWLQTLALLKFVLQKLLLLYHKKGVDASCLNDHKVNTRKLRERERERESSRKEEKFK
jgi:hypothetical protein